MCSMDSTVPWPQASTNLATAVAAARRPCHYRFRALPPADCNVDADARCMTCDSGRDPRDASTPIACVGDRRGAQQSRNTRHRQKDEGREKKWHASPASRFWSSPRSGSPLTWEGLAGRSSLHVAGDHFVDIIVWTTRSTGLGVAAHSSRAAIPTPVANRVIF